MCASLLTTAAVVAGRMQSDAERGEASPESAVTVWLLQLSAGERIGLSRVLADERHDELLTQWQEYRAAMESTRRPPSKVGTERRRDAGGWRVWSAELPPWCGTHVRAGLCPEEQPQQ
ncbi:hypothetical protein ACVMYR_12830 [Micromonospora sp. PTRAS2]